MRGFKKSLSALVILAATAGASFRTQNAAAETINSALVRAYTFNPELNRDRASVRVHDEDVAKAWSGLRPSAGAQGSVGPQSTEFKFPIPVSASRLPGPASRQSVRSTANVGPFSNPILGSPGAVPSTSHKRSSTAVEPPTPSAKARRASSPRALWRSFPSR